MTATDYDSLLDAEVWAFIGKTLESYPEDAADRPIVDQRHIYDTMCGVFYQGRPVGVGVEDRSADGVPVRIYSAGDPSRTVLYFHGGGFVVGGLDSHDDVCAEICAGTGYRVISVDYRLAPEHKHPAAFDDAWTATQWAARRFGDPIVLAGDSAGGNLAAAVAHHARSRGPQILGQVLIYPGLGGDGSAPSYRQHAHAPLLSAAEMDFYETVRLAAGQPRPLDDPTYAPLQDSDFTRLPPTVIVTADCDPLRDDAGLYADRLRAAGVRVHWINEPGLVHGYLRARRMAARARDSFERIEVAIEALGQGLWPYDD
ncbi:MAG: alpha/beta hydrolase [Pseudodonghicola sp.]